MLANKVRLAAVVVAACGLAGGRLAAQGLRNGGFEEVSDSDTVQGWHAVGSFACDTEQVRGGARSIRCEVPQRGANGRGGVMQEIVYGRPDTTPIMFGGWSRAEDVMAAEYCIYLDKEESPGLQVNSRIAELVAAKPVIKIVFSGWGAKGWLYQSRRLGTEGMITQRPGYADLLARMWREQQSGDPNGLLADVYSKLLLMYNLGDVFASADDEMRGPHLYVLQKRGVFVNTYTRRRAAKDDKRGRKWIVDEVRLSALQKAEIDVRLEACRPYLLDVSF